MTELHSSDFVGMKSNGNFVTMSSADSIVIDSNITEIKDRLMIQNAHTDNEELTKSSENTDKKQNVYVKNDEELAKELEAEDLSQYEISLKAQDEYEESNEELTQEIDAEIKAMRYRKLMHLLDNSKMYSVILKDRMEEELKNINAENSKAKKNTKSQGRKKNMNNYRVGDVISEKNIHENVLFNEEKPHQIVDEEDYFEKTKITSMGFTVSYKQPELLEGAVMRDYQIKGLEWLKVLFTNGVNGILADEMGLGKTIQVISFICHMIEQNIKGPFLIIAPLSTLNNWISEFKRFAPKVPTMLYHGTAEERKNLLSKIFSLTTVLKKQVHNVVITSYQLIMRDKDAMKKINWYYLIVDEAQRMKNHNSLLSKTLRDFNTIGKLLLTGTPLQNDLSELWSLLNFLLPEVFNALDVFESWFDIRELESNGTSFLAEKFNVDVVTTLQEILLPFLLRREKKDVELKLPQKKEVLIYCPLMPRQKKMYQSILDRSIELLIKPKENIDYNLPLPKRRCFLNSPYGKKDEEQSTVKKTGSLLRRKKKTENIKEEVNDEEERYFTKISLNNSQMLLRKAVNHPYLIQHPLETGTENLRIDEDLVRQSGKMLVLDALLAKLKLRGHKVVVFSYFKLILDLLEDLALLRGYNYCRMDGESNMEERSNEISSFNSNPDIFVFFITMRSGGLGINLTAADTVIFYDSDWNPQINLQSQDRCHRIGQTKPVVIYRLCVKGTIDEKIIERGNAKRRLEKMILQQGKYTLDSKISKKLNLMDIQELKLLMESTDYDTVINSNGYVLTDEQLDALLNRSDMTDDNNEVKTGGEETLFKSLN